LETIVFVFLVRLILNHSMKKWRCFEHQRSQTKIRQICSQAIIGVGYRNGFPTNFKLQHSHIIFSYSYAYSNTVCPTRYRTRHLFNLLKPNDIYIYIYVYICRTAALTSRRFILNICSTNIHTEYFKHAA